MMLIIITNITIIIVIYSKITKFSLLLVTEVIVICDFTVLIIFARYILVRM